MQYFAPSRAGATPHVRASKSPNHVSWRNETVQRDIPASLMTSQTRYSRRNAMTHEPDPQFGMGDTPVQVNRRLGGETALGEVHWRALSPSFEDHRSAGAELGSPRRSQQRGRCVDNNRRGVRPRPGGRAPLFAPVLQRQDLETGCFPTVSRTRHKNLTL